MASGKWRPFCLGLNVLIWIKFSCVYSRSVTMPGLDQNRLLLSALGWLGRRRVVLANYGVKRKLQGNMCWADVWPTLGQHRPCDVGPTSLRRWVDVARRCRPNIGSMSVTILEYYNQNKQKCSTMKRHDSFLSSKKLNNGKGSLHDACKSLKQIKQFLAAKNRLWCTQRGRRMLRKWSKKSGSESMNKWKR